jgi:hypothetical protein
MSVIASGNGLQHLNLLLEFLAAWENRPGYLTSMAYEWCSAISEAAGRLGVGEAPVNPPPSLPQIESQLQPKCQCQRCDYLRSHPRPRPQDLVNSDFPSGAEYLSGITEEAFSHVGPDCDPVRTGGTSHHTCECPRNKIPLHRVVLLPIILEIGFHLVGPGHKSSLLLNHTSHHEWMFKVAFSSDNDETIADAVNVWIVCGIQTPPGSFVSYLARRAESSRPFSPRLQQAVMQVIRFLNWKPKESGLEAIHLLNHLSPSVDDVVEKRRWAQLLAGVICLPTGLESMSPHYWHLLGKSALGTDFSGTPGSQSVEMMRSFEEAEDWEKLEVWMLVVWQSLPQFTSAATVGAGPVTRKLLLQRPSTLQRFKDLCERGSLYYSRRAQLKQVCDRAQTEQPPSEFAPPPYVSLRPAQHLSILIPPFSSLQSIDSCPVARSPSFYGGRHLLKLFVVYMSQADARGSGRCMRFLLE